jgi:glycerol-3-phosphate O-acyltransferase
MKLRKAYDPVIPNIEDWPIYQLSEDRKNFIREINDFALHRLAGSAPAAVSDMIAKTLYQERIRMKEEPWKVDPPKDKQFWSKIGRRLVTRSLDRQADEAAKVNNELLKLIIERYSEEIVGTFRISTFLFARRFLTFFFTRLLNTAAGKSLFGSKYRLLDRIIVDGYLNEIRSLMTKGTVVVVPTHFSNLDSILVGYAMDTALGLPSFSYGAGLNLYNTGYTAYFMNRLGAYRVDRRKKNAIYLETLKAMSNLSIQRGVNSLFFPGGTRARSGHLENKLKMGLLGTVVEAQRALYQKGEDRKVFIVPLVLGYHFVLEAQFLIEQHLRQMGRERYIRSSKDASYSVWSIFKFTWQVFSKENDIVLSFGRPMDVLGNRVDANGNSYDQHDRPVDVREYFMEDRLVNEDLQREAEYTKILADRIVERYHCDNIVLTSHLVAFAAFQILKKQNPKLDIYGLLRLPDDDFAIPMELMEEVVGQLLENLKIMEAQEKLKLSPALMQPIEDVIRHGLSHLGIYHVDKPLRLNKEGHVVSDDFKVLYYYHNRLDSYALDKYVQLPQPTQLQNQD